MARILITGSTDGLGMGAAEQLLDAGHHVVVHARNRDRAVAVDHLSARGADLVVADLTQLDEVRSLAEAVNQLGRMDSVIHNAGVAHQPHDLLPVNVVAPYMLTALMARPDRLIYISSMMHLEARPHVVDADWTGATATHTYPESKLLMTALADYVARRWPDVYVNAVCPGWMPTKMGGAEATGDLRDGVATQVWLAVSGAPEVQVSGQFWQHMKRLDPHPSTHDIDFQRGLIDALVDHTGVTLPT